MKRRMRTLLMPLAALLLLAAAACSYDEEVETCLLSVELSYETASFAEPQAALVRVELTDQHAQVFVDSAGADRTARFRVPPGIYEAATTASYIDSVSEATTWRYNFNGVRSQIVVSPDSLNRVEMQVRVSRRRVVR